MSRRIEFTRDVIAEIVDRAKNARGQICCEGCGLVLGFKCYEIDHNIAQAMGPRGPRQKLTAADGRLLGECCHKPKTKRDKALIAEAKRREAAFKGLPKARSRRGFYRPPDARFNWTRGRYERLGLED